MRLLPGLLAFAALIPATGCRRESPPPAAMDAGAVAENMRSRIALWVSRTRSDPADAMASCQLASLRASLARLTGDHAGFAEAEKDARHSLEVRPRGNPAAKGVLASTLGARHRFREALATAQDAIAESPHESWLLGVRGDAELELGDVDAARRDYGELGRVSPGPASWLRLARIAELTGHLDLAIEFTGRALKESAGLDPLDETWTRSRLGALWLAKCDRVRARTEARAALSAMPGYVPALVLLSKIDELEGDTKTATDTMRAVARTTSAPEHLLRQAELLGATPVAAELRLLAMTHLERELQAGDESHLRLLAEALLDARSDPKRALDLARRDAAQRSGVYSEHLLARACRAAGLLDEAIVHAERSLRLGTADPALYLEAEAVYRDAGKLPEAGRCRARALEIDSHVLSDPGPLSRRYGASRK